MKVSEVNIALIKPKDGLIGFASIIIEDCLYLGNIGIYQKLDFSGYRLTYPKKGEQSIFYPIKREAGKLIEDYIFAKLHKILEKMGNET